MHMSRTAAALGVALALAGAFACAETVEHGVTPDSDAPGVVSTRLDSIVVWGEQKDSEQAGYTSPVSTLHPEDLASINMATTEDAVKYEPSIVIRRRFIGDSNGTLGMRGSNMFQTSRSMVFADGVPLHYFLESRWNGAPRWTMVSSSEIARVDVLYGPFSAEYSGNSMGGVVLIETAIPQQREFHFDGMLFSQSFKDYGFDDSVNGFKGFMSYGDRIGDLSVYLSYNHLDNESQPMTFNYASVSPSAGADDVTGGILGRDDRSVQKMIYGDTGIVDTKTDNYKLKLGYDLGNWSALLNVAYEDRNNENVGNTYVHDLVGNPVWSGAVTQDGLDYTIGASNLGASIQDRNSLNVGLRLKGELGDSTHMEVNLSSFDVLKDKTRSTAVSPNDPAYAGNGQVKDYDDTGWTTAEAKWTLDNLGVDGMSLVTGVRREDYQLNIDVYDSNSFNLGSKDTLVDSSGGETSLTAGFAQVNWDINQRWDSSLGLRYESWESRNGYYAADDPMTPHLDLVHTPSRSEERYSPKFSLGMKPANDWVVRYSIARAYRFPIVEELYSQYAAYNSKNLANPDLNPEDGVFHNIMIERGLDQGYLRVNLYRETIQDVIESQTDLSGPVSVRTFVPVDEVQTSGIEFIANVDDLFIRRLDVRYNIAYTDSEITRNSADPTIIGNRFPRMPKWRSNLLATYHLTHDWDIGGSIQYASDSFGRLDNTDHEKQVYGAQDGYTRLGLKTTYRLDRHSSVGLGVDNLTDETAYVAHPWPGRTLYLNYSFDM